MDAGNTKKPVVFHGTLSFVGVTSRSQPGGQFYRRNSGLQSIQTE